MSPERQRAPRPKPPAPRARRTALRFVLEPGTGQLRAEVIDAHTALPLRSVSPAEIRRWLGALYAPRPR
ncbi:MAG: hypothetical protein D6776_04395 [Planctomycetota bacterium]|nr:MAG: hypothetical protein D6776_04395 [Planctomycetota bacterium]